MPVLYIRIVLDTFYLPIFYSEKFSTWIWLLTFGVNVNLNLSILFLSAKTGTGLSCTIYKIPVNFSLSLDLKPGTGNPNKWYRQFRSFQKNGKKNNSKDITFFRKISTGMNRSIWIIPRISGFSMQMVSALNNRFFLPYKWFTCTRSFQRICLKY